MNQMQTFLNLKFKQLLPYGVLLLSTLVVPFLSYSQAGGPPPPTGSGGGNASVPDSPLGVPFDWRLNTLLLLAGIVFSVIVIRNMQKQKAAKEVA
jgi:hypothetical protein